MTSNSFEKEKKRLECGQTGNNITQVQYVLHPQYLQRYKDYNTITKKTPFGSIISNWVSVH